VLEQLNESTGLPEAVLVDEDMVNDESWGTTRQQMVSVAQL